MWIRFEVKLRVRLGLEAQDQKGIRIFNSVLEWTIVGIRYEMDQRHTKLIVSGLGLSKCSSGVHTRYPAHGRKKRGW